MYYILNIYLISFRNPEASALELPKTLVYTLSHFTNNDKTRLQYFCLNSEAKE